MSRPRTVTCAPERADIDTKLCPLYLLTGEYDYSCTPDDTREVAARVEGAQAIIMDGMGHFPMSEDPESFLSYLRPVLASIVGNSGDAS